MKFETRFVELEDAEKHERLSQGDITSLRAMPAKSWN